MAVAVLDSITPSLFYEEVKEDVNEACFLTADTCNVPSEQDRVDDDHSIDIL